MSRAKVGTGTLRPFKDERVEYESISTGKSWSQREGFTENVVTEHEASRNVTKLEPFKTGPEGPGRIGMSAGRPGVVEFHERNNGIPAMPKPFSDRRVTELSRKGRREID